MRFGVRARRMRVHYTSHSPLFRPRLMFAACSRGEVASKVPPTDAFYGFRAEARAARRTSGARASAIVYSRNVCTHARIRLRPDTLALVAIYAYRRLRLVFNAGLLNVAAVSYGDARA